MRKLLSELKNRLLGKRYTVKGDKRRLIIGQNSYIDPSAILNNSRGGIIEIGDNCNVFENVIIATYGGDIRIGDHTSVNPFCVIYGHGGLTIGKEVRIATHTVIIPSNHRFDELEVPIRLQGLKNLGIIIENNVWIGAGVRILDGVIVGENSIIAAGAVVTKSIERNSIVAGVPAKLIRKR